MKTLNEPHRDFIRYFQTHPITYRHFLKSGSIYIRVDEHFARANGYRTLAELAACVPLLRGSAWMLPCWRPTSFRPVVFPSVSIRCRDKKQSHSGLGNHPLSAMPGKNIAADFFGFRHLFGVC